MEVKIDLKEIFLKSILVLNLFNEIIKYFRIPENANANERML
jgi:hypothetical protein